MMLKIFLAAIFGITVVRSAATSGPCKGWCGAFCLDSCQSTLATPICMGEAQCRCLCPTTKTDCNNTWCDNYCSTKSQGKKFEAQCADENQVCKCQFEQKFVPGQIPSKIQPTNITFVADSTLLNAEFKCTQKWCDSYCTLRGENRKFKAHCDETQSCHCEYEKSPLSSLSSLANATTQQFKCTHEWCSKYCGSKSDREYVAKCNAEEACECQYPRLSGHSVHASGAADNQTTASAGATNTKFHCTQAWCDTYCTQKSNGRQFKAWCNEQEACKCEYAWKPTGHRTVSTASIGN